MENTQDDGVLNLLKTLDDIDQIGDDRIAWEAMDKIVKGLDNKMNAHESVDTSTNESTNKSTDESTNESTDESTDEIGSTSIVLEAYLEVLKATVLPILLAVCVYMII